MVRSYIKQFNVLYGRTESKFERALSKYLLKQRSRVLNRLRELDPEVRSFPPGYRAVDPSISDKLLPPGEEDALLAEEMADLIEAAGIAGASLAIRFDSIDPDIEEAIRLAIEEAFGQEYWRTMVNDHTRARIAELVRRNATLGEGGSMQLARDLRKDFFFSTKRAVRIARTESTSALNGGQYIAQNRLFADEIIDALRWLATRDEATRNSHNIANGQTIKAGEKFTVGGFSARYPGDPNLPARERIHCFLPGIRIEGRVKAAARSWYDGQAVELKTASGSVIRVTQNHPVFTSQGTVPAGAIKIGDQLIGREHWIDPDPISEPYHQQAPVLIEDIFHALAISGLAERRGASPFDLHGDGQFIAGQIEIVRPNWELILKSVSPSGQFCLQFDLPGPDIGSSCGIPSRTTLADNLCATRFHFLPFKYFCLGAAARFNAGPPQSYNYSSTGQPDLFRDPVYRHTTLEQFYNSTSANFSAEVATSHGNPLPLQSSKESNWVDTQFGRQLLRTPPFAVSPNYPGAKYDPARVESARHFHYSGWVYDVETDTGCILAEDFTFSNCRCTQISVVNLED